MGYRKLATTDIEDLLRRWQARQGVRQIARETGIDRKTIRRYVAAARDCSIGTGGELSRDDVGQVIKRVQTRPPRSPSEAWSKLLPYKEQIAQCVDTNQRLRLGTARAMLADKGIDVTYWTLRRFAIRARNEKSNGHDGAKPDGHPAHTEKSNGHDGAKPDGHPAHTEKSNGHNGAKPDGHSARTSPGDGHAMEKTLDQGVSKADGHTTDGNGHPPQQPRVDPAPHTANTPPAAPNPLPNKPREQN